MAGAGRLEVEHKSLSIGLDRVTRDRVPGCGLDFVPQTPLHSNGFCLIYSLVSV
jgi:hypothetical protein